MKSLILLFTSVAAWAQLPVINKSTITITDAAVVSVSGSFRNEGTLINNGTLTVSGEWSNPGTYDAGRGLVSFTSSQTQIINHNAQSFQRLTISGGGKKIFNADIEIQQELRLNQGILESNNQAKIVFAANARAVGGSAQSFVQGPLYHTGTGNKFFPIGVNNQYLPVTLPDVRGNNPVLGLQVFEPNPFTEKVKELATISSKRYWRTTIASGTFESSIVVLPLPDEDFTSDISNLVAVQSTGNDDPFTSLGQSLSGGDLQSGFITSQERVTLPIITLGEIDESPDRSLVAYNAVTPNGDLKHDFLKIENIEFFPSNVVAIVNRWGEKVFEIEGYNNADKIFRGEGNLGSNKQLSDGTYYYVIDKRNGDKKINGYFVLSR